MNFDLNKSLQILERTPQVLEDLLQNLHEDWAMQNEGKDTFSPYDVIGHLIHGEKTDWIQRLEIILSRSGKAFEPYDRFAQYKDSQGKSLKQLLDEFKGLRKKNLEILRSKNLGEKELDLIGQHPRLGSVTLRNLLSTWTVHDLSHLAQISRVMCKQYKEAVGPWQEFLPVLTR